MIPFKIPPWRKKQIDRKYQRKSKVVHRVVSDMEVVMESLADHIVDSNGHTPPVINSLYNISERFYRSVVENAVESCDDEKESQKGKKRLAKGPTGITKNIKSIDDIFKNKRYWQAMMKRSRKLTEKLLKGYLRKLNKRFNELLPLIRDGQMSPADAKKQMREVWGATKPRVETIFRTETTNYFEKTQVKYFKDDPEIIGFMFDSVRDSSRTDICRSRHGMIYTQDHVGHDSLSYNTPALHYNCRSHLIALANTPENVKLLKETSRDPAKNRGKIKPLDPKWR